MTILAYSIAVFVPIISLILLILYAQDCAKSGLTESEYKAFVAYLNEG